MATRISLQFYGDTQLDRTLTRMLAGLDDMSPVWDVLADRFGRLEARQFASEGGHASGGWAPLSPAYARWKAKHYPGRRILERTGRLRESLTQRPFGVEAIERQAMTVGSAVPYGLYHQRGDGLPQRRPVELTELARVEWLRTIQRFVMTGKV